MVSPISHAPPETRSSPRSSGGGATPSTATGTSSPVVAASSRSTTSRSAQRTIAAEEPGTQSGSVSATRCAPGARHPSPVTGSTCSRTGTHSTVSRSDATRSSTPTAPETPAGSTGRCAYTFS